MKKRLRKKWHFLHCTLLFDCRRYSKCVLCRHFSLSKTQMRGYYRFCKKRKHVGKFLEAKRTNSYKI